MMLMQVLFSKLNRMKALILDLEPVQQERLLDLLLVFLVILYVVIKGTKRPPYVIKGELPECDNEGNKIYTVKGTVDRYLYEVHKGRYSEIIYRYVYTVDGITYKGKSTIVPQMFQNANIGTNTADSVNEDTDRMNNMFGFINNLRKLPIIGNMFYANVRVGYKKGDEIVVVYNVDNPKESYI